MSAYTNYLRQRRQQRRKEWLKRNIGMTGTEILSLFVVSIFAFTVIHIF